MKRGIVAAVGIMLLTAAGVAAKLGGGDIIFTVTGEANVLFSHDIHAGRTKIGCKECHYAIFTNRANHTSVTMAEIQKGRSCGVCHDGKRAFGTSDPKNCSKCHSQ